MKNVIFIPGITGTTLVNTNTLDYPTMYSGIQRYFRNLTKMGLQINALDDEPVEVIIERSHVEAVAYKEIVDCLGEGYNTYIFGYDWRKSNTVTAEKLNDFVMMLRRKLGNANEQFYFITHSMGGLVLLNYIKQFDEKFNTIQKIAFNVPPFAGAPEALKGLVMGESYFVNTRDNFRKIARTFPGMYELLPWYNGAILRKDGGDFDIYNPYEWQSNLYIAEREKVYRDMLEARLKAANKVRKDIGEVIPSLSPALWSRILVLAGDGEPTLNGVEVDDRDATEKVDNFFNFEIKENIKDDGDGTVPFYSSQMYKQQVLTLKVKSTFWQQLAHKVLFNQHAMFLTDSRVQTIIGRFFDDKEQLADYQKPWWSIIGGSVTQAE